MNLDELSIQELLSLGYIYLLILGVITDTIFYSFFGLHIIAHSDILDILLSPINILTENLIIPVFTILGCLLLYFVRVKIKPKRHAKNRMKESYRKKHNIEKLDEIYSKKPSVAELIRMFAIVIFSLFIGIRIGGGLKLKQRMEDKSFSYLDVITFLDSEKLNTAIIGQNSIYIFYVAEGDDKLTVAPIAQNVKTITKRLKKEDKKTKKILRKNP